MWHDKQVKIQSESNHMQLVTLRHACVFNPSFRWSNSHPSTCHSSWWAACHENSFELKVTHQKHQTRRHQTQSVRFQNEVRLICTFQQLSFSDFLLFSLLLSFRECSLCLSDKFSHNRKDMKITDKELSSNISNYQDNKMQVTHTSYHQETATIHHRDGVIKHRGLAALPLPLKTHKAASYCVAVDPRSHDTCQQCYWVCSH